MAVRVRTNGDILCAAMHPAEEGDCYIDDGVHYLLCEKKLLVSEAMFATEGRGGHAVHGQWWWKGEVPPDVVIDPFDLE